MPLSNSVTAQHTLLNEFEGKVAIVTGTTGIGRAIARRFAQAQASVVACGIDADANRALQAEADSESLRIHVQGCDVSEPAAVAAAVACAVDLFGGLDVVVNAAAIHPYGTAVETDWETWNRCLAVNAGSVFLFAHYGVPEIKKRGGGSIVNLASVQGHACQQGVAAYVASKGAIHSLTRALAVDHAADNIRVNSISPGSVNTPMLAYSAHRFSPDLPVEEVFQRFGQAHPLGRIATAEEVAELAAFLASERASFCTGGDYLIDGGLKAGLAVR
jgi:meso-butanediol dehydrogenase / (S,S)-butanediol dehydrogenase / diacetyl reductase